MSGLKSELNRYFRHEGLIVSTSAAVSALIQILSPEQKRAFLEAHAKEIEAAQAACIPTALPQEFFDAFEEESQHIRESAEP